MHIRSIDYYIVMNSEHSVYTEGDYLRPLINSNSNKYYSIYNYLLNTSINGLNKGSVPFVYCCINLYFFEEK